MNNTEVEVKVRGRLVKFPAVDGLTPIEVSTIIWQVEEKIKHIEEKMNIPDTGKLAMLAAYEFAVELYNLKRKNETDLAADSKKVEDMILKLEACVEKERPG